CIGHGAQLVVVDVQPSETGQLRDLVGDRQARVLAQRQRLDARQVPERGRQLGQQVPPQVYLGQPRQPPNGRRQHRQRIVVEAEHFQVDVLVQRNRQAGELPSCQIQLTHGRVPAYVSWTGFTG